MRHSADIPIDCRFHRQSCSSAALCLKRRSRNLSPSSISTPAPMKRTALNGQAERYLARGGSRRHAAGIPRG